MIMVIYVLEHTRKQWKGDCLGKISETIKYVEQKLCWKKYVLWIDKMVTNVGIMEQKGWNQIKANNGARVAVIGVFWNVYYLWSGKWQYTDIK